jgi:3-oxoadipate enol-lactonase
MSVFNYDKMNFYYDLKGNLEGQETIVFLNGVMASANSWDYFVPFFEKLGYKVLVHDFRGQLRSDKPKGPYSFKQHANDVNALLNHLDIKGNVHLIGTSYGGEVAMRYAIDYPEHVKSLSIIDSVSELDEKLKAMVSGWKVLAKAEPYDFFCGMAPTIYGNSFMTENKAFLEKRANAMNKVPKDYYTGQIDLYDTFVQDVHMTEELPKISCPALVVCGTEDILKEPKFSKIIADSIPNSEYVLIPDCGHVTIFEKPKELASLLVGFVLKN